MASSAFVWVPFILQAGAVVLLFFVILAGVTYTVPLNETFFLSADISSFNTGIDSPSGFGQWTLWGVCGATTDGKNVNCGSHHPAYPFDPAANFNGSSSVPIYFAANQHYFYYTSRIMFAFFLIALAFAVFSLFSSLLALCSRIGSAVTSVFAMAACVFDIIAASLMTAVFVQGRDHFQDAGITASLGVKAFGFAWGSVGCLLFASFGFCCAACGPGRRNRNRDNVDNYNDTTAAHGTRTSRFWRRRNRNKVDTEGTALPATY